MKAEQFLSRYPLRRQAVALLVVILVPAIAVIVWAALRTVADRERDLRDEAASIAVTAGSALEQYFATVDSLGRIIAEHPAVESFDEAAADRLFKTVLDVQPTLLNVIMVDRGGVLRATAVPTTTRTLGLRPYAQQVLETGRSQTSDLTVGRITGRPTVIVGYPVHDAAGERIGVIGISLNLFELGKVFANIPLPPGSVITITDAGGRILARTLDADKYVGRSVGTAQRPADVPRTSILTGVDGMRRVFSNVAIDRGPWLVSVGIPVTVAYSRVLSQASRNAGILIALVLVSFGLSFVMIATVTGPLVKATSLARRIAGGDLSPPPTVTPLNFESAELQRALVTMATNLREARARLDQQVEEERRMREVLQSLQRQVVRQERLAAVGVLVSGVAHELNNPLQAILGGTELLERRPGLSKEVQLELELIKTQSERARDIIRKLSRFGSQQAGPPELVDLRDVISEVLQLRNRDLGNATIAVEVEISSSRRVLANFTEVEQVLLNFVINAQHAIEAADRPHGRVMIRFVDAGKRVRVEVIDDGPGVAPADEPKLFQPFFTTKPVGKGTGLGLSVSYGIVESYGGAIGYHPNDWGGATFFFELPAADSSTPRTDDRTSLLHGPVLPGV